MGQKTLNSNLGAITDIEMIADSISKDVALRLIKFFAGSEIKIPKKIKPTSRIVTALGMRDALRLSENASGDKIYIPVTFPDRTAPTKKERDQQIIQMCEYGVSRAELATHFGVTQRHIRRILNKFGKTGELGARTSLCSPISIYRLSNSPLTGRGDNSDTVTPKAHEMRSESKYGRFNASVTSQAISAS